MKTLQFSKTFGQFALTVEAEVDEQQLLDLAKLGALYLFERSPSSQVEQDVFAPMLGWAKGERGTSYKRPEKFQRGKVEFTPELAEKVKAVYNSTPGTIEKGNTIAYRVLNCVKHEGGETASEMVRATTFVKTMMDDEEREKSLRGMFGMLGMENADTADFTALVAFAHDRKIGIQPTKAK